MKFSQHAEHNGIQMELIGQWSDLVAYYKGSDGKAWAYSTGACYGGGWANEGDLENFVRTFSIRRRGVLHAPTHPDSPFTNLGAILQATHEATDQWVAEENRRLSKS